MATKLSLFNDALRAIGDIRLATTSDDVEARYVLDDAWVNGLAFIFTEGLWNFAAKTSSITGTTVGAIPGFSYSFTKPPDWVRTIVISTNSLFDTEATYRDENGKFYSNWDTLYIRYTSNTLAADGSISSWPTMFCEVASAYLAAECCEKITGNAEKADKLRLAYKETLASAKNKDAMDQPKIIPRLGNWARSMNGRSSTRDRGPLTGY